MYLVIGAGIVGLAVARELAKRFPEAKIVILEKEKAPGLHASGRNRNSGVLHSGIYYPPHSLKAKVCAEGARRMAEFAEVHRLPIRKGGKVIIPTQEKELEGLQSLMENARANQIRAELLEEKEIRKIEPHCSPYQKGIYLPDVSVIDPAAVIAELVRELRASQVEIYFEARVKTIHPRRREVKTGLERFSYEYLFNCAGAYADQMAKFFDVGKNLALVPFKGTYWRLRQEKTDLVRSHIYPVPDPAVPFLGIHFTRGIEGEVDVGPTAMPAFGRENYDRFKGIDFKETPKVLTSLGRMFFSSNAKFRRLAFEEWGHTWKPHFVEEAKRLVPELRAEDLVPSPKVGIRPQLVDLKKRELVMDYVIERTRHSTHVLNAISPAFTSAFRFAELILEGMGQKE